MKPETFRQLIHRVLNEEVTKKNDTGVEVFKRLPEVVHGKDYKEIMPHKRDKLTKEELLSDMDKVVKDVDKDFMVVWDDHDDISITGRDLFRIRVMPKWENNYALDIMTRNEDRIYIGGQSWEQTKDIVKLNLKNFDTGTDKAWNKVTDNRKDKDPGPDKGLNQKNRSKVLPLTDEPPKTTKNKDKNYTEVPKDNDDLPEKPMKEVKDFKKLVDYKVHDPVKLRKRNPDTKLTVKQS